MGGVLPFSKFKRKRKRKLSKSSSVAAITLSCSAQQTATSFDTSGKNVQHLRAPLLGHRLGSSLNQMGILSPIILGALDGTLTSEEYYKLLRTRKTSPRYQRELFKKAISKGHTDLAKSLGEHILKQNPNRAVRLGMRAL